MRLRLAFLVVIACLAGSCSAITIWPSHGPETQIREVPGKYAGVESYYEDGEFSGHDAEGHELEGMRWQLAVQRPGKFKLDVTGPKSEPGTPAIFRMVSDGKQIGVQSPGETKLSLQPLPDPLKFYQVAGLMEGYKASPYLSQSLMLPWVFHESESQADLLIDKQQGVEVGTYWGEECVVYTYGDEAVKRLWRGKERAEGGLLRVWVAKFENKIVREEWQVRLAPEAKAGRKGEIQLTFQHRNVRLEAVLEGQRFALEALPPRSTESVADGQTPKDGNPTAPNSNGTSGSGAVVAVPPAEEKVDLPAGPRGVALAALIKLLRNLTPETATGAAVELHHNGRPEGMQRLGEWVRSKQARWVGAAAKAAAELKERALKDGLLEQTSLPDPVERVWVYRALYALGDSRQIEALEDALHQPNVSVQIEATRAISELRSRAVLEQLTTNLTHADPDLRDWSAHALGELADGRAREALETALASDTDPAVRASAALALRKIGDPNSREALMKAMTDPKKPVSVQAAGALAHLGSRDHFTFILAMLKVQNADARHEAFLVLGALQDPGGAEHLRDFVAADPPPPDAEVEEAAIAMGKIGGTVCQESLRTLVNHPNEKVRLRAAAALAKMKDPAAIDPLVKLTGSDDSEIVLEAAKALLLVAP